MSRLHTIQLAAALLGPLACLPAGAQTWSISGALASPERATTTSSKITPFFSPLRGAGVQLIPGTSGRGIMYLPVTAPHKALFNFMHIRVEGVSRGLIKAELYEQAIAGVGAPTRLGVLTAADTPGDGVQVFTGPISKARPFDLSKYTYFIRAEVCKDGITDPKLYEVSLTDIRCVPRPDGTSYCPPPPPWPERACKVP